MRKLPGIYVHLPFCDVHCSYCDFPLTTRISLSGRYYQSLFREMQQNLPVEMADTLYFGGGTPSLTPPEILSKIKSHFRLNQDPEVTLEANPEHITTEQLSAWKEIGVNRLSVGIQSLEPNVLKSMLRLHTAESAWNALKLARKAGYENLNVDLILGYPGETTSGFLAGLESIVRFKPEHVSLYMLELHENTALVKQWILGKVTFPEETDVVENFTEAVRILKQSGYEHYEVSNFAIAGFTSRHNLKYWTDAPYYAYGAGACSYRKRERTQNLVSIPDYIRAVESGGSPLASRTGQDEDTIRRNALIFGLRKTCGIQIQEYETEFGISPLSLFGESLDRFVKAKLLEVTDKSLRLTFQGMLLSNEVLSELV